jgi:short-subunit dehydrogenase
MANESTPGYVLITGASSGIGAALAREYARRGRALILTARRQENLDLLARELAPQVRCEVITADLADPDACRALQQETVERGLPVDVLVNNAGYGLPGSYTSQPWDAHARFLQVMVSAVCELSHRFLPAMQAARRGAILNVASLAGHVPGSAGHTLYAASKAFMIKFSESLALENADHGVQVSALCPGFTYSEFHDVTGTRGQVSKMPKWMWMDADTVAREGIDALERGEVVHVAGRANRAIKTLTQLMPDRWALRLVQKRSKDFRKT